jgi:hypothetical protein
MGSGASLPAASVPKWTNKDVQRAADAYLYRDKYSEQIEKAELDGQKLIRLNEDEFRRMGFFRIGWPSYMSVVGELDRVTKLYGEEEEEAVVVLEESSSSSDDEEGYEEVAARHPPKPLSAYSCADVVSCFGILGLGQYTEKIQRMELTGELLNHMTMTEMEDTLGIPSSIAMHAMRELGIGHGGNADKFELFPTPPKTKMTIVHAFEEEATVTFTEVLKAPSAYGLEEKLTKLRLPVHAYGRPGHVTFKHLFEESKLNDCQLIEETRVEEGKLCPTVLYRQVNFVEVEVRFEDSFLVESHTQLMTGDVKECLLPLRTKLKGTEIWSIAASRLLMERLLLPLDILDTKWIEFTLHRKERVKGRVSPVVPGVHACYQTFYVRAQLSAGRQVQTLCAGGPGSRFVCSEPAYAIAIPHHHHHHNQGGEANGKKGAHEMTPEKLKRSKEGGKAGAAAEDEQEEWVEEQEAPLPFPFVRHTKRGMVYPPVRHFWSWYSGAEYRALQAACGSVPRTIGPAAAGGIGDAGSCRWSPGTHLLPNFSLRVEHDLVGVAALCELEMEEMVEMEEMEDDEAFTEEELDRREASKARKAAARLAAAEALCNVVCRDDCTVYPDCALGLPERERGAEEEEESDSDSDSGEDGVEEAEMDPELKEHEDDLFSEWGCRKEPGTLKELEQVLRQLCAGSREVRYHILCRDHRGGVLLQVESFDALSGNRELPSIIKLDAAGKIAADARAFHRLKLLFGANGTGPELLAGPVYSVAEVAAKHLTVEAAEEERRLKRQELGRRKRGNSVFGAAQIHAPGKKGQKESKKGGEGAESDEEEQDDPSVVLRRAQAEALKIELQSRGKVGGLRFQLPCARWDNSELRLGGATFTPVITTLAEVLRWAMVGTQLRQGLEMSCHAIAYKVPLPIPPPPPVKLDEAPAEAAEKKEKGSGSDEEMSGEDEEKEEGEQKRPAPVAAPVVPQEPVDPGTRTIGGGAGCRS